MVFGYSVFYWRIVFLYFFLDILFAKELSISSLLDFKKLESITIGNIVLVLLFFPAIIYYLVLSIIFILAVKLFTIKIYERPCKYKKKAIQVAPCGHTSNICMCEKKHCPVTDTNCKNCTIKNT